MGKQNRLRVLHVRHAGHRHMQICFGQSYKRGDQLRESRLDLRRRIFDEQSKIRCHQFIATASGMLFPSQRS